MTPQTERRAPALAVARLARAALETHVPVARAAGAVWAAKPNAGWVRWTRADGIHLYLGLRRHLDWVTGEAGISREAVELESLPPGFPGAASAALVEGRRVRLGELMHGEDRWWPAGTNARELSERLEWLALQFRAKAEGYFARHAPGTRSR